MCTIHVDSPRSNNDRRRTLYSGDLFAYSPSSSSAGLCTLARELSEEAFAPHDPATAQDHMPAERYVGILAELKPRFIHHPQAKELIGWSARGRRGATSRRPTSTSRGCGRWRTAGT